MLMDIIKWTIGGILSTVAIWIFFVAMLWAFGGMGCTLFVTIHWYPYDGVTYAQCW